MGSNTDARTVSNTTLNREYQLMHDTFGWEDEQFMQANIDALNASALNPEERERLIRVIQGG